MRLLRRALLVIVVIMAVLYSGAIVWLIANETRLVFVAQPLGQLRPSAPFEEIAVPGEHGLHQLIWVMRSPTAAATRPWLFFLHGNATSVASRMDILHYERLRRLGFNVVTAEYRGYGGMEGVPSETGIESDARAAFDTICERFQLDPRRVVVYGWSLGSAVAVDLASHVQPAAVILEGAPASIMAIGQERYPIFPVRWIMRNPFESILKIRTVTSPKLFLHSRNDELVPIEEGHRLFDAAPPPKQWVEVTGGHVYAAERDPAFFAHVESFLAGYRLLGEER
jgi:fermentation-respiration switch protein FrsA (DUF1100 family)